MENYQNLILSFQEIIVFVLHIIMHFRYYFIKVLQNFYKYQIFSLKCFTSAHLILLDAYA